MNGTHNGVGAWLTLAEAGAELGASPSVLRVCVRLGVVPAAASATGELVVAREHVEALSAFLETLDSSLAVAGGAPLTADEYGGRLQRWDQGERRPRGA